VAYQDFTHGMKATVMKFNGTNWVNVGNPGFSVGEADYTSLAFSPSDGEPYVAFRDWGFDAKATVKKFDENNWVYEGNAGFSAGEAASTSLAFSLSDGLPYVAYSDGENSWKATVMKCEGTNWVNVGSAGFSAGPAYNESFAINSTGEPYIAYTGSVNMLTVMTYDSVYVGINDLQQSKFSIYPNPATDKITVELTGATMYGNLTIVDIEGQQLITYQITQPKTQIDISNLASGVYFVRVTNDKTVEVGKFVKE
jgi:hypothetical protein